MRIRSTRPVFWRSKTIAQLDWPTRLVLKGLESYVDDNGVGKDSVPLICADVFPYDLSRDPSETIATVSRALQSLTEANLIVRYEADGEELIYVRNWRKLQKIDNPNPGRLPRPDGSMNYKDDVDESVTPGQGTSGLNRDETPEVSSETIAKPSLVHSDCPATVVEEKGSRGTEEKEPPYPPSREPTPLARREPRNGSGEVLAQVRQLNTNARSVNAFRIAEAFSASLPAPIERNLLAGIGKQIDECLKSNIPPAAIAAGLKAWTASDSWSPTQIPNFVHKANNRTTAGKPTAKAHTHEQALAELLTEVTTL